MYFTKFHHPSNFAFATLYCADDGKVTIGDRRLQAAVEAYEGDIWKVEITADGLWTEDLNLVSLAPPPRAPGLGRLTVSEGFEIQLTGKRGRTVLASEPGMGFGTMGPASLFAFRYDRRQRFFGLGEKVLGRLELSRIQTKFWNTDVMSDFHPRQWVDQPTDPYYISVPYLIVQVGDEFVGLLYHNPCAPFFDTGCDPTFFGNEDSNRRIVVGAEDGRPSLWLLYGPTLPELTEKFQRLVGTTPRPPLWALGYHQSRWGYRGERELRALDRRMARHGIPCDGLWLDIDYMRDFRVFTVDGRHFPSGVAATVGDLAAQGRRVVPILDPGVKLDPEFKVYQSGRQAGAFCKNPSGGDFVGYVWPGQTVYPDFSLPEGREWWAGQVAEFARHGFHAVWIDMNDPSTGSVDPSGMLFRRGTHPHLHFRNQYALGMQMATREGLLAARSGERPFVLSRSGYVGTSRYAAVWTGDSCSNRFHLKACIPTALNLSLSGIPFLGNDVGGFVFDTSDDLMVDWTKACFLFPFFRIHSTFHHRPQEPWTFGREAFQAIRRCIRLRYRLLPYLYNLFLDQAQAGAPILRPVHYHYPGIEPLEDQFLVGDAILQAPFLEEARTRRVVLPGREPWWDARTGKWCQPDTLEVVDEAGSTPLFVRSGAILPTLPGERKNNSKDLRRVEFHLFASDGEACCRYRFDDGLTFRYREGASGAVAVRCQAEGSNLLVWTEELEDGFGPLEPSFVAYGAYRRVWLNGVEVAARRRRIAWTGKPIAAIGFRSSS